MHFRAWVLALILLTGGAAQAREFKVVLGVQDAALASAPADVNKGAAQSGGLTGFNEALAREICRRATVRCVTVNKTFAEILPGVESGEFDLGFGNFLRTPEREKRVAFSAPIWRSSSRLLARPAVAARFAGQLGGEVMLDTLRNARVAVVDGTQQHAYLRGVAAERALQVMPHRTMAEVIAALRDNQADFLLMPVLSTYALISREPPGSFEFVGLPVADRGLGGTVHIAVPKQKEEVLRLVDQAIATMRADGTYQRIARQFFPFSLD